MTERDEDMGDGDRAELGPEALEGRLLCTELGRGRAGFRQESACGFNSVDASNPESALKIGKALTPPHVCSSRKQLCQRPPRLSEEMLPGRTNNGGNARRSRWKVETGRERTEHEEASTRGIERPVASERQGARLWPLLCTPSHQCLPSSDRIRIGNNTSSHAR